MSIINFLGSQTNKDYFLIISLQVLTNKTQPSKGISRSTGPARIPPLR